MKTPTILLALGSILAAGCELVEPPDAAHVNALQEEVQAPSAQRPAAQLRVQPASPIGSTELDAVALGLNGFGLALLAAQSQGATETRNLAFSPLALQSALLGLQKGMTGLTACELGTKLRLGLAKERAEDGLERLKQAQDMTPAAVAEDATLHTRASIGGGAWRQPFEARASRPRVFHGQQEAREVVMMHAKQRLAYLDHEDFQLLTLPLRGEGRPRSLILLLPRSNDGLGHVEGLLEERRLCHWIAEAQEQEVDVTLPRLSISSTRSMRSALQQLGIRRLFSRADALPAIGRPLNDVRHVAHLSLHEAGIGAEEGQGSPPSAAQSPNDAAQIFRADHPFLLILRDDASGALLFFARIVNL